MRWEQAARRMQSRNSNGIISLYHSSLDLVKHYGFGIHYYTNFTGGGCFRFSAAGKAVRRGLEATVNRGLTAAGGRLIDLPRRAV